MRTLILTIISLTTFFSEYKSQAQDSKPYCIENKLQFTTQFDTLISKGDEVIFFKPTAQEYKLLYEFKGEESGIKEVDSDFDFYSNSVSDSLKNTIFKVVLLKQRVVKIIAFDNSISYFNRLDNGSSYYGVVINFSKSEPLVLFGVYSDIDIFEIVRPAIKRNNPK